MRATRGIIALSAVMAFGLAACNRTPTDVTARTPVPNEPTTGQRIDDAAITAKVKSALIAEPNVPGMMINVDTTAGQVTLRGRVENRTQAERAVEVARGVEGVQRVDNQLSTNAG